MLFRKKCPFCGYWTVFRLTVRFYRARQTCTYCDGETSVTWSHKVEEALQRKEEYLAEMETVCRELQCLKEPGDHVKLPFSNLEQM